MSERHLARLRDVARNHPDDDTKAAALWIIDRVAELGEAQSASLDCINGLGRENNELRQRVAELEVEKHAALFGYDERDKECSELAVRVEQLEAERDKARQWANVWKRAAAKWRVSCIQSAWYRWW